MDKEKYELEYLLKTSIKVLDNMVATPSGLSEWFADDVNIKDDVFTFFWDGSEEEARRLSRKNGAKIRWQWLEDEEEGEDSYFELFYEVDPMTKSVILTITDFAEPDEMEEAKRLWDSQINNLRNVIGA
ncbi:START-like domain-containing protein [Crocinitomicaceae bacterium]|nr:START-like domain-containing protein [Crocinitomicaceae bacterium]MDC0257480.1 START-like domain-containing protein [Crocinitomicaceae bacterium]